MRSLLRFSGVTDALELSVPVWGPLFDLTGSYVQGVLVVPEMFKLMRLATGILGDSYCRVGRISYLILLVRGEGVSTPLLRRTE